jgi:hypothetical protein
MRRDEVEIITKLILRELKEDWESTVGNKILELAEENDQDRRIDLEHDIRVYRNFVRRLEGGYNKKGAWYPKSINKFIID